MRYGVRKTVTDKLDRKLIKAKLREAGLSNRQIKAFALGGWPGLCDETDAEEHEQSEQLKEAVEGLRGLFR